MAGYPLEESSWEPRSNLRCPDLLAEFEAQQLNNDADALAVLSLTCASTLSQTAIYSSSVGVTGTADS